MYYIKIIIDMSNIYLENIIDWAVKGAKLRNKDTLEI
jgi:hypothetical protein